MTKFKVGDTVRVKSLEWYNENKDYYGNVWDDYKGFRSNMASILCGKIAIIEEVLEHEVGIRCEGDFWRLSTKFVEPIVKEDSAGSLFMNDIRRLKAIEPSINVLSEGSSITFYGVPFDATETNIITSNSLSCSVDWYQYRFDLIKAVLPALVQSDNSAEHCAKKSIEIADEVIKLLKDEKNISDGI